GEREGEPAGGAQGETADGGQREPPGAMIGVAGAASHRRAGRARLPVIPVRRTSVAWAGERDEEARARRREGARGDGDSPSRPRAFAPSPPPPHLMAARPPRNPRGTRRVSQARTRARPWLTFGAPLVYNAPARPAGPRASAHWSRP